jgi:hypothetical protein
VSETEWVAVLRIVCLVFAVVLVLAQKNKLQLPSIKLPFSLPK